MGEERRVLINFREQDALVLYHHLKRRFHPSLDASLLGCP